MIQPSPVCGFSENSTTRSPSSSMWPKRAGGRTAVSVASLPCERWNAEQLVEIEVGDPVAPGEHERRRAQEGLQSLDAAAGRRVEAGVDEVDGPVARASPWWSSTAPSASFDGEVGRERGVLDHVALDDFALVPEGDDEVVVSVVRVVRA